MDPAVLHLARRGDAPARTALAARRDLAPELLTFLAADPAPEVRRAVAANPATPALADRLLSTDAEVAVRAALAARIAHLAPGLGPAAQDRAARMTAATLTDLAGDVAEEVRAALAEVLAAMPGAPRDLILRLAQDTAARVAEPVIRLSPLLEEADLIALALAPPAPFTRRAVAARPGLPAAVCDAIAESGDSQAIAALLRNPSAAIREAALDMLAEACARERPWQPALVRRPALSPRAIRSLSALVTEGLLRELAARADLPPGMAGEIAQRVGARLEEDGRAEAGLMQAARAGDRDGLLPVLAAAAGLTRRQAEAALALRSPRALAALCWRAGWSARLCAAVQAGIGGLSRQQVIGPNAEGGYALTAAELAWQSGLLDALPE